MACGQGKDLSTVTGPVLPIPSSRTCFLQGRPMKKQLHPRMNTRWTGLDSDYNG